MECCKIFSSVHKVGSLASRPSAGHALKLCSKVPKAKLQARGPLLVQAEAQATNTVEGASALKYTVPVTVNGPPMAMSTRSPKRRSEMTAKEDDCEVAQIAADNDAHPDYTVISLKVKGFPGLLRQVTWVLTGLGIEVHRASLRTDMETGLANDVFYVTDTLGQKLGEPQDVVTRLTDFVQYCAPNEDILSAEVFEQGPIKMDNTKHATCTSMSIDRGGVKCTRCNVLLEVVATLTGVGVSIVEADINADKDNKWRFLLQTIEKEKLNYTQISGLLYTLTYVLQL
mmetsp:Transcript_10852/g.22642  ORF Transcript_10852/g.22642 Transcript_10852/m.22642 type:complete len:285 (-) Transcript_10852:315-1169(-)|eukprot:CAMPEP_0118926328 /NCGR_PEP_ID=MMETSP1169-20130426/4044_1 /TAXON_ID=36882 /ORGANISM="Pyramimonas obovata, Strain CCMP722" /LENGTH=284 /DNA_ID=CAMNT_0006867859 /DNA_START=65 /DNA_END=919 /DNA_ORIENTATION=-